MSVGKGISTLLMGGPEAMTVPLNPGTAITVLNAFIYLYIIRYLNFAFAGLCPL